MKKSMKIYAYMCKIVMILLYRQSSIECHFSINKDILDNNLRGKSLISHFVYDHFPSENIMLYECVLPQALKKL